MSFVTSRVATFDGEIHRWSGLGKSGVRETAGNGLKMGLAMLTPLPGNLPGNFPDLPGLRVFDAPVNGARNGLEKRYWNHGFSSMVSRLEKLVPGPPGPETSFVTSRVATFDHEIDTWFGLGKCGVRETDGNGLKIGLAMLTSLLGNLPGNFPDLPGLLVF